MSSETFEQYAARFGSAIAVHDPSVATASFLYEFSSFLKVAEGIKSGPYVNSRGESLEIRTGVTAELDANAFAGFSD